MHSRVRGAFVALVVAGAVAGCGGSDSESEEPGPEDAVAEFAAAVNGDDFAAMCETTDFSSQSKVKFESPDFPSVDCPEAMEQVYGPLDIPEIAVVGTEGEEEDSALVEYSEDGEETGNTLAVLKEDDGWKVSLETGVAGVGSNLWGVG